MTARRIAFDVLNRCEKSGQYSNLALDAALKREALNDQDRALTTVLVYGVIEKRITLDYQISRLSARPIGEISPDVLMILRLGLYQLAYLDRIPDHAAVNEAVEQAGKKAGGFVNAILRAFIRGGKQILFPDEKENAVRALSVRYSVGEELCAQFVGDLGKDRAESILRAFSVVPPLTVRVNTQRITRDKLLELFLQAGLEAERSTLCQTAIRVRSNAAIPTLPGFAEGYFFVQDEASQLCVEALDAHPDMRILDTCACPGSKSFGIAINMQNRGVLYSCDLHASKLSLVNTGAQRLGISILQTLERDARRAHEEWESEAGNFDRILCDVPCSGFGVLAKKPELRYKSPAECAALPSIQLEILKNSARFLKVGGKLVYSTCTLLPEENERNVERFLADYPQFSCESMRTLYPDTDHTDGFFIAVLSRAR